MKILCFFFLCLFLFASCTKEGYNSNAISSEMTEQTNTVLSNSLILQDDELGNKFLSIYEKMNLREVSEARSSSDIECFELATSGGQAFCSELFESAYAITYPGIDCELIVTMRFKVCSDPFSNEVYFAIFGDPTIQQPTIFVNDLPSLNPECIAILEGYIGDAETNEDLQDGLIAYFNDIEMSWEQAFVEEYFEETFPENFDCSNPDQPNLIVEHYEGTCFQFCIGNIGEDIFDWEKTPCGTGCCVRRHPYCVNKEGEAILNTDNEVYSPGEEVRACTIMVTPNECQVVLGCDLECTPERN